MKDDGIQAVELRQVFGLNHNSNNQPQTIREELDFFAEFVKEEKKKCPDFSICFLQTSVKKAGVEHFKQMFKIYEDSIESHPGMITGFDMVHYEDSVYIKEFMPYLFERKEKNPKINYYLHAGETLNPNNNNVIDSVLLGTKRIGHGLSIANSTMLIDLVKKENICVEINPLSNYLLGYVRDLRWHPAKILMNSGVKISINPDDYTIWDIEGTTIDFLLAAIYWDFDLKDLKWCI